MIELNVLSKFQLSSFLIYLFAFFLTFFLVPLFSKIAFKFNILDKPDGKLKKHSRAIPYLGGVAIYFGFVISLITAKICLNIDINILFLGGITLLLILGLVDDLYVLSPKAKILGQFLSCLFLVKSLINFNFDIFTSVYACFLMFWLLSLINAFNLIDIMDGLAISVACLSATFFLFYATFFSDFSLSALLLSLLGATSAFYCYNKPPAKIYLGDAGSLFLGGTLAFIPLTLLNKLQPISINLLILPIFLLAVPILELIGLILIRMYKKIPIYLGSPDHFAIYLQKKGWAKGNILVFAAILSVVLFFISFFYIFNFINIFLFLFLSIISLLLWCIIIYT